MPERWTEDTQLLVGSRLKRARQKQRLSVRAIAELAGLSKTSVVQAESGRTSRRSTYLKLCTALGLELDKMTQLNDGLGTAFRIHQQSNDVWFNLDLGAKGPLVAELQRDRERRFKVAVENGFLPMKILSSRLEDGSMRSHVLEVVTKTQEHSHPGEEFVYVLSGKLMLKIANEEITLNAHESIVFWSSEIHCYGPADPKGDKTVVLSICADSTGMIMKPNN